MVTHPRADLVKLPTRLQKRQYCIFIQIKKIFNKGKNKKESLNILLFVRFILAKFNINEYNLDSECLGTQKAWRYQEKDGRGVICRVLTNRGQE